jgi:hypothetical protein
MLMQSQCSPNAVLILPEAMQALLEQAKPYQSRSPEPGIARLGDKRTKDQ